jgi:hypothetical protein
MENLDEILKTEQTAEAPEAQAEEMHEVSPIVDPPSERLRDEKGRFAPKETGVETQAETPPATEAPPAPANQLPQDVYEPLKAIRNENKQLREQLAAIQQQLTQRPQAQQQPAADFWDDPQSFMDHRMAQLGDELFQRFEQRQQAQRLDASERAAQAKYADYPDAFAAFEQAVQTNPRLAVEMAQSADPGEYVYRTGKAALTLSSVGSLEEYEAQLRAKWEAEVKAAVPTPRPILPSTTAADGSVGARTGPAWSGPTSLNQMLG